MSNLGGLIGWGIALAAFVVGYVAYGPPGLLLALSVVVFWLLLQFSRALRAMRSASSRPLGAVDSAVMFNARLHRGMRLMQVIGLTRSLGLKVADEPETFAWTDEAGDSVHVVFVHGRCDRFTLQRAATTDPS